MRTFLVRGSYGTGFLAPSLYQLYAPAFNGVTQGGVSDPVRCPVTGAIGVDCETQFGVLLGGNANLKPEQSEQTSAGVVLEPIPGATFSVDWLCPRTATRSSCAKWCEAPARWCRTSTSAVCCAGR